MASGTIDSLRVSDLTHFRHMVGSHSTVLRVGIDGELTPAGGWPLQVGMPIHEVLRGSTAEAFDAACQDAIASCRTMVFETDAVGRGGEVTITPVLDDQSSSCRYLVCWIRERRAATGPELADMRPDEIELKWRRRSVGARLVVEAAPIWVVPGGEPVDLWEHAEQLVSLGVAPMVLARILHRACAAVVDGAGSGFGLCLSLPAGELLNGIVPTVVGVLRATGLAEQRITLSVPVTVAVEEHRRATLMHLQALGLRLEVQGSGQLAKSLFGLDDRYAVEAVKAAKPDGLCGPWAPTIPDALVLVKETT